MVESQTGDAPAAHESPAAQHVDMQGPGATTAVEPGDGSKISAEPPASTHLTVAEIRGVIRDRMPEFKACTEAPDVTGTVNIQFWIEPDGSVSGARIATAEFAESAVGACVCGVFASLRFRAHGAERFKVTYPIRVR